MQTANLPEGLFDKQDIFPISSLSLYLSIYPSFHLSLFVLSVSIRMYIHIYPYNMSIYTIS